MSEGDVADVAGGCNVVAVVVGHQAAHSAETLTALSAFRLPPKGLLLCLCDLIVCHSSPLGPSDKRPRKNLKAMHRVNIFQLS